MPYDASGSASRMRADGEAVTEQQVVRCGQRGAGVLHPGGVPAGAVAQHRRAVRLVQGDPAPHPVAEVLLDGRRELGEPVRGVAVRPAARVLERLRKVPVVERHDGRDAPPEQLVDQPRVEVDTVAGSRDRGRRAGSGATRPTAGRRRRRGPPSARRPRGSGGSGRRPRRRCRRRAVLSGVWLKVSQIDGPRPPSCTAPSIWYDAMATPSSKPGGSSRAVSAAVAVSGRSSVSVIGSPVVGRWGRGAAPARRTPAAARSGRRGRRRASRGRRRRPAAAP